MTEGKYGDAENLARAKDTAVEAMKSAGFLVRHVGPPVLHVIQECRAGSQELCEFLLCEAKFTHAMLAQRMAFPVPRRRF
jgi:hypothetical protein